MSTASPYKGLEPYGSEDRNRFFGRGDDRRILIAKLFSARVTLLFGLTGAGKSSLLGAGIIPELTKQDLDVSYHFKWHPREDPRVSLKTSIKEALFALGRISSPDPPGWRDLTLKDFLEKYSVFASDPFVIVIDQFEELFLYHTYAPFFEDFIRELSDVINNRSLSLGLVFSMREDFLAELDVFWDKVPSLFTNSYRLKKLTLEQAREAIVRPVEQQEFGFRYEEELLDALVKDLTERENGERKPQRPDLPERSSESVEAPYLQIVCSELWNREQNNSKKIIRKKTYDYLGGANTIVKRYFERVMEDCTRSERKLASQAFTYLVTEWGTKMPYHERVLAKLLKVKPDALQTVLQKLKAARILRDEKRPEGTWYELYHDVFTGIIEDWNNVFLRKKHKRLKIVQGSLTLALLVALGVIGYLGYQTYLWNYNIGELEVRNPYKANLTLIRIRHYRDEQTYPPGEIPFDGRSVYLVGPADYMLTAQRGEEWTVKYPVYIQEYTHQVEVIVNPPPEDVPEDMIYIPGGVFRMGDKDDKDGIGGGDELPHHDVEVDGFFIDQYEVTNAEYQKFIKAGGYEKREYWTNDGWEYIKKDNIKAPPYLNDNTYNTLKQPVVGVTWYEADAYCRWWNKRLPTEAEWEKAATGPEGYKWAFGNVFDGTKANFCDQNCDLPGKDEEVNDGYRYTAPVGMYPSNEYGLYDMSGNVSEWVEDWYDEVFYGKPEVSQKNPVNRTKDQYRILRSGSWGTSYKLLRTTDRFGFGAEPDIRDPTVGFRCVLSFR